MEKKNSGDSTTIETEPGITIEGSFTGHYGMTMGSVNTPGFKLVIPEGATDFAGFIRTHEGDFWFEGSIEKTQEAIKKIKEYCLEMPLLTSQLEQLKTALRDAQATQTVYGPTSRAENFDKWSAASSGIERITNETREVSNKKLSLEHSVSDYRV